MKNHKQNFNFNEKNIVNELGPENKIYYKTFQQNMYKDWTLNEEDNFASELEINCIEKVQSSRSKNRNFNDIFKQSVSQTTKITNFDYNPSKVVNDSEVTNPFKISSNNTQENKLPAKLKSQSDNLDINLPKVQDSDCQQNYEDRKLLQWSIPDLKLIEQKYSESKTSDLNEEVPSESYDCSHINNKAFSTFNEFSSRISATCHVCKLTENLKRFPCSHSLCTKCLVLTAAKQFDDFLEDYKLNQGIYYYCKFEFKCTVDNCLENICVPFNYLINKANCFLDDNDESFKNFAYLRNKDILNGWTAYVDIKGLIN